MTNNLIDVQKVVRLTIDRSTAVVRKRKRKNRLTMHGTQPIVVWQHNRKRITLVFHMLYTEFI